MFGKDKKAKAIETLIKNDGKVTLTIQQLGYPSRATMTRWKAEYELALMESAEKKPRKSKYGEEQQREAVGHYLGNGKNASATIRELGYPKSAKVLLDWVDEYAPGERRTTKAGAKSDPVELEVKARAVALVEAEEATVPEIAEKLGVSRTTPYAWFREMVHNGGDEERPEEGMPVDEGIEELPDDVETLQDMLRDAKLRLRAVQLELDVREATLEIVKKDPGTDPNRLTNAEKSELVDALRPKWALREILPVVGMAKSSYEYARKARGREEGEGRKRAREAIVAAFNESGGTYGYRRVLAQVNASGDVNVGEWTVREVMAEESLHAKVAKRKKKYSSYEGEISEAPANLLRDEHGKHDFSADAPNEEWITDVTEFHIPAGKVYLSPILDCFDGIPLSWSISTSPNAEMANSSLLGACEWLSEGEHPVIHSDRGCHYRWPGWIEICDENGLVRSMSRKGCSPDNSRAEGFFGRLKIEFFYDRDWSGVTLEEFADMLDAYMRWYRDVRIKSDLGYMSPMQYRQSLGLAA